MSITERFFGFLRLLGIKNLGISFFKVLSKIGVTEIRDWYDDKNSDRAKCLWETAKIRGIKMYEIRFFGQSPELFWSEYRGKKSIFECLPRPLPLSKAFYWMDNKGIMKEKFNQAGLPIALGAVCTTYSQALEVLNKLAAPVITKPNIGSRSRHTTIHITTPEELKKAFNIAKRLSPWVIVEQELKGTVHRVTLIGGKLIAVMRRDAPFVKGDGASTIKELVEKENLNPKRKGPYFHEIPMDEFANEELQRQGLQWSSVLPLDKLVIVRNNIGRSSGGSNTDLTPLVHPENKILFEKIALSVGDPLIGMDFIIEDVTKPWSGQLPCGTIELNSVPFLDLHHFPLYGDPVDASGALWDIVYPEASSVSMSPR
ncbi:MAG: hypothetical protein NVS3B9_0680 [Candidatus Doudnabacteria bacterium]